MKAVLLACCVLIAGCDEATKARAPKGFVSVKDERRLPKNRYQLYYAEPGQFSPSLCNGC